MWIETESGKLRVLRARKLRNGALEGLAELPSGELAYVSLLEEETEGCVYVREQVLGDYTSRHELRELIIIAFESGNIQVTLIGRVSGRPVNGVFTIEEAWRMSS